MPPHEIASARQADVARLLYVEGRTQQEAARTLGVSQRTISYYAARIAAHERDLLRRAAIADAVVALGQSYEPDGQYDPADDPRPEESARALAALIDEGAAAGVASGLMSLWTRWVLEQKGLGE